MNLNIGDCAADRKINKSVHINVDRSCAGELGVYGRLNGEQNIFIYAVARHGSVRTECADINRAGRCGEVDNVHGSVFENCTGNDFINGQFCAVVTDMHFKSVRLELAADGDGNLDLLTGKRGDFGCRERCRNGKFFNEGAECFFGRGENIIIADKSLLFGGQASYACLASAIAEALSRLTSPIAEIFAITSRTGAFC